MPILINRSDGTISIMYMVGDEIPSAVARDLQKWKDAEPGAYASHQMIKKSEIPASRIYRDAWGAGTGAIRVDMLRAREIHRNRLREIRKHLLAALDVAYTRADERGDKTEKERITSRKQALRDVTSYPAIEAATTPEELEAAVPEILNGI